MTSPPESRAAWASYHLYYHEDLERAARELLGPVSASLVRQGAVDRFFFIRYYLGGPHLRWRLRIRPGAEELVGRAVASEGYEFFSRTPSRRSCPGEVIARANESILATDSREADSSVYPDNSLREAPFEAEVERYGGAGLLPHSLDLFAISSVEALDFFARLRGEPRSRRTAAAFRLLFRQALAFAAGPEELLRLLRYGVQSWGSLFPTIEQKAEKVFDRQRESFRDIVHRELEGLRWWARAGGGGGAKDALAEGASALSGLVGTGQEDVRWRICGSQLHMTANRLGLRNPEEVYLSRLLVNAGCDLRESPRGRRLAELQEALAELAQDGAAYAARLTAGVTGALEGMAAQASRRGARRATGSGGSWSSEGGDGDVRTVPGYC